MTKALFAIALSVSTIACGSSQPTQSVRLPQDTSANVVKADDKTCDIDYKKICQQFIDQPEVTYNGKTIETNRLAEELGGVHPLIEIMPSDEKGESFGAGIQYLYSAQPGRNKVVRAGLKPGESLTEHAVQYAQSKGLCGKGVDFQKEITDQQNRLVPE